MTKYLIINADDFGYTQGVSRAIVEAHRQGTVTSASLMVNTPGAAEAADLARQHPDLGVGLHFVGTHDGQPLFDLDDPSAAEQELDRQYRRCRDLLGRQPTHLDSHEHIHLKRPALKPLFAVWAKERGLPLRGHGAVHFNGGFYGQRFDEEWLPHSAPELIRVQSLEQILRNLPEGATELACHPGYFSPGLDSYGTERAIELATLLDPRVPALIRELCIQLIHFGQLPAFTAASLT